MEQYNQCANPDCSMMYHGEPNLKCLDCEEASDNHDDFWIDGETELKFDFVREDDFSLFGG